MTIFKGTPAEQRSIGSKARVRWGEIFGAYGGFGFLSIFEGPREPGPIETEISMRRVIRPETNGPELQIAIELTQRYASGANSRRMLGSISLRGPSLAEFARRLLLVEGSKAIDEAKAVIERYDARRPSTSHDAYVALRELLTIIDPKS